MEGDGMVVERDRDGLRWRYTDKTFWMETDGWRWIDIDGWMKTDVDGRMEMDGWRQIEMKIRIEERYRDECRQTQIDIVIYMYLVRYILIYIDIY